MNKMFISKHKYNHIKKCLRDLNNTFRNCTDNQIIATHKASLQDTILNLFDNLSEEQTALLDILKITDSLSIDQYLADLEEYVYGIVVPTSSQIKKVFRKEAQTSSHKRRKSKTCLFRLVGRIHSQAFYHLSSRRQTYRHGLQNPESRL